MNKLKLLWQSFMKMTEKVFKGAKMWEVIFLAQVKKTQFS